MSGRSLLPLVRGARGADPRVVVSEGRQSRAILWENWRLRRARRRRAVGRRALRPRRGPGRAARRGARAPGRRGRDAARFARRTRECAARPMRRTRATPGPAAHCSSPLRRGRARAAGLGDARRWATASRRHVLGRAVGVPREPSRSTGRPLTFALATAADALVGFDVASTRRAPRSPGSSPSTTGHGPARQPSPVPSGFRRSPPGGGLGATTRARAFAPASPVIDPSRDSALRHARQARRAEPDSAGGQACAEAAAKEMQRSSSSGATRTGSH